MNVLELAGPQDDVEDLMDGVRDAVESWEHRRADPDLRRDQAPARDSLEGRSALLREQWRIDANAVIHSSRPRAGPWLIRMQLLVRRATWWFVEPVAGQIRRFQRNSARLTDDVVRRQSEAIERIAQLEERIARLESQSEICADEGTDAA